MKESTFQKKVKKKLESMGAMVLNLHGHAMQAPGWPDLYVAHPQWEGWIELKVGKGKLSKLQEIIIRRLRERGVNAVTAWDSGETDVADAFVQRLIRSTVLAQSTRPPSV